jgi:hypothetical protein
MFSSTFAQSPLTGFANETKSELGIMCSFYICCIYMKLVTKRLRLQLKITQEPGNISLGIFLLLKKNEPEGKYRKQVAWVA